ncbi:ATP-binding cassette domain-containing protein [Pseudoroseomonas globiformis]|uniref:ATP-binding cassette domain-containing protein n=1 Tax=Teichococcus globiformis TaxID=2307229 RepID=A0ABV7G2H3_9PROT
MKLEGLTLAAGNRVLVRDLSLEIRRGQVLGLLGASGGGKSLTVMAMLGLLPPGVRQVAGRVTLDGQEVDPARLRGATLGLVQQSPRGCFNPLVSIGRHFRETLSCEGLRGAEAERRAAALLHETGFADPRAILALYPSQMSGGMLQRTMLALALARDPAFLLADEPTTDLDLVVQARILDLLETLARRRGLGVLLVTHDLSVLARLADDVAVMEGGRIVDGAPVQDFFAAPRHPRSRALLAAHLALHGEALP